MTDAHADWPARAQELYERAVFYGDADALDVSDWELDSAEANLALARGRVLHARFLASGQQDPSELVLFERAALLFARVGDARGQADALFWVGTYHQVVRRDEIAALSALRPAYDLAVQSGDKLVLSYVVRHLGFADLAAGRMDVARERLEESVQLRREVGFQPGVAAGLLALAECAAQAGERGEAERLLSEAQAEASSCGAVGVLAWIEKERADIAGR